MGEGGEWGGAFAGGAGLLVGTEALAPGAAGLSVGEDGLELGAAGLGAVAGARVGAFLWKLATSLMVALSIMRGPSGRNPRSRARICEPAEPRWYKKSTSC